MRSLNFIIILLTPIIISCNNQKANNIEFTCQMTSLPCLKGKKQVKLITNRGSLTFEIDGDASPLTAGNFIDLVKKNVYKNTIFHRVIKLPGPFVVQGGDPYSKIPNTPKTKYGSGNYIDPSTRKVRFIPLEIKLRSEKSPRYNQLITNPNELEDLQLIHEKGSIAMARAQSLDSASSQFYIGLRSLPELNGRYSVFGRMIKGKNTLDNINQGDKIIDIFILGE